MTPEDKIQRQLTQAAAQGLAAKLKDYIGAAPNRELRNLGKTELMDLAAATVSAYALKRAELEFIEDFLPPGEDNPFL